jgi:hypothetical protein
MAAVCRAGREPSQPKPIQRLDLAAFKDPRWKPQAAASRLETVVKH